MYTSNYLVILLAAAAEARCVSQYSVLGNTC
jgi:hypothetical protein